MPATRDEIRVPNIIEGILTISEGLYCVIPLYTISYHIPIVVAMIPENKAARMDLEMQVFQNFLP